jgi:dipeptidyl aminopeptidase/acylaminoacyl peptidase
MKSGVSYCARFFALSCVVAASFRLTCPAQGQVSASSRAASVLDSMPHARKIDQVAMSPDGMQLAYIVDGEVKVFGIESKASLAFSVEGKLPLRDLAWSADSKQLAFLADLPGDAPSAQLWTVVVDGGAPEKRAGFKGYAESPRFSPDGSELALLFIEGMPRAAGPLEPMTPLAGVVGGKVYEQRLETIELDNNTPRVITPADMYVYEYDWAPDGQSLAAIAAHGDGDANWWVARLYRVKAQTGEMHEIYAPKWQIADAHVSPDGKNVAFIEGLMSDAGLTGGDIQTIPFAGGRARNLTPEIKSSPSALAWAAADRIVFAQNSDGNSSIASVSVDGGQVQTLWTGEDLIGESSSAWEPSASFSRDGSRVGIVRQSANSPPEVSAGPIGKWQDVTGMNIYTKDVNGTNIPVKAVWGETRNVHWMNGNTRVQGWLTFPKDFHPGKTYPLVVNIHGGPAHACTSRWDEGLTGAEAALGYFALCPNPRGSYGQGEAFTQGNVKDFGGGDYRDIMAGVDSLAKQYPIDTKRIGIRGHSYGGYMAMWAETQTTRFAAAVAGAGLSDWLSYYGLNDIDEWMIPFFGASVYEDPAVYAKSDPMRFVKAVKTPTLILVGDRDGEVPMEQSVEWWHALKAMNVPTTLVVYPNEGHLFVKPADARDYNLRTLEWFEEWFGKAAGQ